MWTYEHFVEPDIIAFGKKLQVGGVIVNSRIDDIENNVFKKVGRINSTWGGNLTDLYRAKRYLEIIKEDNLVQNADFMGAYLLQELLKLQFEFPEIFSNARGRGLMCAIDLKDKAIRDTFRKKLLEIGMMILGCGEKSIRFRPRLNVTRENIDEAIQIMKKSLTAII